MRLKIASRKSDLARIQAYSVGEALLGKNPALAIEYLFRESLGDKNQQDPLWKMPERGVFTEDFHAGLLNGEFDLVVHSWKDLPVANRAGTEIAATLKRADLRDLLLMPKKFLPRVREAGSLKILSSSPRRKYNLGSFLSVALPFPGMQLEFSDVRGNIPTRLRKLFSGEGDALVVAKAAIDRILSADREEFLQTRREIQSLVSDCYFMVLPTSQNPTAAAQGALAIEVASTNASVRALVQAINEPTVFADIQAEREILAAHGGGCHQKIGVNILRGEFGRVQSLRGETDAGEKLSEFAPYAPAQAREKQPIRAEFFPQRHELSAFFKRRHTAVPKNPGTPLFVTKVEALPESWEISWDQIIWTAGIKTWQKLAERGIWVSGTSDSLGETNPEIANILGAEAKFTKLTHSRGEPGCFPAILHTYELLENHDVPNLHNRSHFYWMSSSQFDVALRRFPEIVHGNHACGAGHTAKHLRRVLGDEAEITICLSYDEWRKEFL